MKLYTFVKTILRKLNLPPDAKYKLASATQGAIHLLLSAGVRELSCNDVHSLLDEFDKAVNRNENILIFMPLIRQHLDMCPDCREKYESILMKLQP